MMHFCLLQRQNVCMVNVWLMGEKRRKKKVKQFLPTVICGGTQHTTIEIALYIHTPTDTHTLQISNAPPGPSPNPISPPNKRASFFSNTHSESLCVFVWVCAYECVLEQKAQADATLFEQQQLPSSQQAGDLSRTAVGSQVGICDLHSESVDSLAGPHRGAVLSNALGNNHT